jgi:hypothetical protein
MHPALRIAVNGSSIQAVRVTGAFVQSQMPSRAGEALGTEHKLATPVAAFC